jgi:sec-independent protein translocase protein TatC
MKTKKKPDEMSFLDHLEDLRWMLVRSAIAILAAGIVAFCFSDFIFNELIFGPVQPDFYTYKLLCDFSHQFALDESMCIEKMDFIIQNTDVEGQVSILVWICIVSGFIMAFPYILFELWKFISPALYERERRHAKLFISVASALFFTGVLFGYFIVVPMSVTFFSSFKVSDFIQNEFNVDSYIGMIKTSVIASGLYFELPIIIYFLTKLGLVSAEFLKKYRRYAIVIIFIIAAIVTPPDVVSQIIIAIPMMLIYEACIVMSKYVAKKESTHV